MSKKIKAKIFWIPYEQGGRKEIPFSDKYAPIIKIINPKFEYNDFWSIFVMNKSFVSENVTIANMEYLSDSAPDNLSANTEFKLYEGNKMVATGVVL